MKAAGLLSGKGTVLGRAGKGASEPAPQAPQQNTAETREIPPVRALTPQISTVASEKSTIGEPAKPAAR